MEVRNPDCSGLSFFDPGLTIGVFFLTRGDATAHMAKGLRETDDAHTSLQRALIVYAIS
jgi:hypothetical protein